MAGSSTLNLSLLSRGVGEVTKNGHEKVEVVLEPEDYFNWAQNPNRLYLPPLRAPYPSAGSPIPTVRHSNSPRIPSSLKDEKQAYIPKTFTTRKGALLLFSEDMAIKNKSKEHGRHFVSRSVDSVDLRTVDDLAKSILSYGMDQDKGDGVYMGFVRSRRLYKESRQIRPGFSAKRYLATWTRSWDDSMLHKLLDKGFISDGSLQQYNSFIPNKRMRLNDDLSHFPPPYRLLRTMLLSPGSLSGYTFYRIRPESEQSAIYEKDVEDGVSPGDKGDRRGPGVRREATQGTIKILQTKQGEAQELEYNELDRDQQEEVLTDLLVKSAIHHALEKQQEYLDKSFPNIAQTKRLSVVSESELSAVSFDGRQKTPLPDFNMREAVESLLDSQKGRPLFDGSGLPGQGQAPRGRPYSDEVPVDGHFPVFPPHSHDGSSTGSTRSGKHFAQVQHPLPPIADEGGGEREDFDPDPLLHSSHPVLPPIADNAGELDVPTVKIEPPTPQHSTLTNLPGSRLGGTSAGPSREPSIAPTRESEDEDGEAWGTGVQEDELLRRAKEDSLDRKKKNSAKSKNEETKLQNESPRHAKGKGPVLAGGSHLQSSRESLGASSTSSQVHMPGTLPSWRGSQQSLKSGSQHSKKGSVKSERTIKGSVVYAPGGEIVNVGGAVGHAEPPVPALDMNRLLDGAESAISEDSGHLSDDEGGDSWRSSAQPPGGAGADGYKKFTQKRDVDVHAGDIDATMSMHSWSYMPKESEHGSALPSPRSIPDDSARSRKSSARTAVEQGLIDALTEHAQKIAASVLQQGDAGQDLADDIKNAANLWMTKLPTCVLSRSQSVQELPDTTAVEEIARTHKRNSAAPTVAEYKELIRKTLSNVVARQMGMEDGILPDDAEISQELMEALTNQSLTPEDLEVVRSDSGKSIIRAKSAASNGLKEGHLYQPVSRKGSQPSSGKSSPKPPISIPTDRQSAADVGPLDVINIGTAEQTEDGAEGLTVASGGKSRLSSARSVKEGATLTSPGEASPTRSQGSGQSQVSVKEAKTPQQELAEALEQLKAQSPGKKSQRSDSKSKSSLKSKTSKAGLEDRDEFVVGKVADTKELEKLYAPVEPPPPPKEEAKKSPTKKSPIKTPAGKPKAKKKAETPSPAKKATGKKKKKKDRGSTASTERAPSPGEETPSLKDKASSPVIQENLQENIPETVQDSLEPDNPDDDDLALSPVPSKSGSEESADFNIIRDVSSPEPDPEKGSEKLGLSPEHLDAPDDEDGFTSDASSSQLQAISNKDARAAKRAAQAEKRRQDVERKRREREEQMKRDKGEMERQEQLKREMEETRRKKEEERRLKKQRELDEMEEEEERERERERRALQEMDRDKRMKEEYQRKLEEVKRRQAEADRMKREQELERQAEEERRRLEEEEMLYSMAEQERIEYERKKKLDIERKKREEEEARFRREEEAARALEEARKLAEEMARRQAELEARLKFNRALMVESKGLGHTQDVTRAFVYSYFELLQWLGLDIPEFDLQKLQAKY